MVKQAELTQIAERCEKATEGPWRISPCRRGYRNCDDYFLEVARSDGRLDRHDAAFIANARQDIPKLLTEIERLRETLLCTYDLMKDNYDEGDWVAFDCLKSEVERIGED